MKLLPRRPLEEQIAVRIRHTHRDPAEWCVTLRDGRVAYIVAVKNKLIICTGNSLDDALRVAKDQKGEKVSHGGLGSNVSTDRMLEVTGLLIGEGVTVNERVPGDVF